MISAEETLRRLRELRNEAGYSRLEWAYKTLNRERLQTENRQKRKPVSPAVKRRLFESQRGLCACGCEEQLLVPFRLNHADHIDPNREDFNAPSNIALLLPQHNLQKGAKSIHQRSKETGRTYTQLLGEDE